MTSTTPSREGFAPFTVPGANKPCQTWYMQIGSLSSPQTPLVALHGGPGAGHEYLLPLQDLHTAHGIPLIFYDQIGNGRSTRLREKAGDETFWTEALFCAELDNLLDYLGLRTRGFDLYGQSWGGMLASKYATLDPKGLRKLVIADSPASAELMMKGVSVLRKGLPEEVQKVLKRCEAAEEFESKEYEAACEVFNKKHLCRLEPWPEEVNLSMEHLKEDPTVYRTMWGPSEMLATGNLKDWTIIDQVHRIKASTLLIAGRYDEVAERAVQPFFDGITRVKWIMLENSSHMGHFEEREKYMEVLGQFLNSAT